MSRARLLALRLHGFKSFAEPTIVEFGEGISAVVGPNGAGKSNLVDALRWALGEQGRSLRIRKAEDVIFAGSERRAALGMADVTIVLDNADRLLPVDYAVVELGRRLYRSGENDYLLNRTRIRLRDLVDLLDAAHLADNAFLFIGQGLVDQALALRPEERRPLFEEVAGVRRHERRRRRAEEQLAEAEANLVRVSDLVAELRPHARRLATQAERLAAQSTALRELAEALLVEAHRRWAEAATRVRRARAEREAAEAALEAAVAAARSGEDEAARLRATVERLGAVIDERRREHEAALVALTAVRLQEARQASEVEALDRERARLATAAAAARSDLEAATAVLAEAVPEPDDDTAATLAAVERALADARAELDLLRRTQTAEDERRAAMERAEALRRAEAEAARRRRDDLRRRLAETEGAVAGLRAQLATAVEQRDRLERALETARGVLEAARAQVAAARAATMAAEAELATVEGAHRERLAAATGIRTRLAELERLVGRGGGGGRLAPSDRALVAGLEVAEDFRAAVAAALGDLASAVVVGASELSDLIAARRGAGIYVVDDWLDASPATEPTAATMGPSEVAEPAAREFLARVQAAGGGRLADVLDGKRGDLARHLLSRTVWVPSPEAVLSLGSPPPGWTVVSRDGQLRVEGPRLRVGDPDPLLERRAALDGARQELIGLEAELAELDDRRRAAQASLEAARSAERAAETDAARADVEARRAAGALDGARRDVERLEREVAWQTTNLERLAAAFRSAEESLRDLDLAPVEPGEPRPGSAGGASELEVELRRRETALRELEHRRAELAARLAEAEGARRGAEARRARAEAIREQVAARLAELREAEAELAARAAEVGRAREELAAELERAEGRERDARAGLDAVRATVEAERSRLAALEAELLARREAVRAAEDAHRRAESAEVEARLALDACRERVVLDLAGLGDHAETILAAVVADVGGARGTGGAMRPGAARVGEGAAGRVSEERSGGEVGSPSDPDDGGELGGRGSSGWLEAAVDRLAASWEATEPPAEGPLPRRIAQLRRRVAELGAVNPFAAQEYAEVKARLERLEAQEADLRRAIEGTRRLIGELNDLVARQFTTTFEALGAAFERRFRQLFGGGQARLLLTEPGDLATTGIDIVARPPGKKLQPLAMLSGGERALTAVALLFAMLEVRPVPFCVLDEVDAALDEANVGRFRSALRELAATTQFVVITHNRGTIEEADALYGVTVGDDSVSRVISLRLDEARDLAAQGQAATVGR